MSERISQINKYKKEYKDMKKMNRVRDIVTDGAVMDQKWSGIVSMFSHIAFVFLFVFGCSISLHAQEQEIDSVQRAELWKQPDFVRAYLVVAEPGGALYSIFGHACLHMVCEAYGLDCVFTYESEDAANRILTFLAGNLKMGMMRLDTKEYLKPYKEEGRGVKEYELNLPIDDKRNLWRVLDMKAEEGQELPYDYMERGCVYACVKMVDEALDDNKIEYGEWPQMYKKTRREIADDYASLDYPWNFMFITTIVGAEYDQVKDIIEKLFIPSEVVDVWQHAKVNGEYLLSLDAHELLPSKHTRKVTIFTPMMAALLILILAMAAWFINVPYIDWLVLGIVTLIGALICYLVMVSTLPCTNWNWLIIPFNILPAICWKWRKYWATPYAVIIALWTAFMLASVHQLVDHSMVVLAASFILILLNKRNRTNLNIKPCERR